MPSTQGFSDYQRRAGYEAGVDTLAARSQDLSRVSSGTYWPPIAVLTRFANRLSNKSISSPQTPRYHKVVVC